MKKSTTSLDIGLLLPALVQCHEGAWCEGDPDEAKKFTAIGSELQEELFELGLENCAGLVEDIKDVWNENFQNADNRDWVLISKVLPACAPIGLGRLFTKLVFEVYNRFVQMDNLETYPGIWTILEKEIHNSLQNVELENPWRDSTIQTAYCAVNIFC